VQHEDWISRKLLQFNDLYIVEDVEVVLQIVLPAHNHPPSQRVALLQ